MKDEALNRIRTNLDDYIDAYINGDKDDIVSPDDFVEYNKEFTDFKLDASFVLPSKSDPTNIKTLYLNLMKITPSQATEERLWAGLAHSVFWDYMHYRWPIVTVKDKKEIKKKLMTNYFFHHGQQRSLLTNGLSSLWWYGHLLYDHDNSEEPLVLLNYILRDKNARGFVLFGSNFSNNESVMKVFLYQLIQFEKDNNISLSRTQFKDAVGFMNMLGGASITDALPTEYLKSKIQKYLYEIINH
jgi:hypothetical protein